MGGTKAKNWYHLSCYCTVPKLIVALGPHYSWSATTTKRMETSSAPKVKPKQWMEASSSTYNALLVYNPRKNNIMNQIARGLIYIVSRVQFTDNQI